MEISRIVCINHPFAVSRLEAMNERFKQQKMQVDLSPGVVTAPGEASFLGCLRAHKNAIKKAKSDKLANILIFEDDVLFIKPWDWIKTQLKDLPEDYDIVRLCIITDGVYLRKHIKNNMFRCWRAFGTQAYLINSKCFDIVLNFPETDPYDDQLSQAGLTEYAIHPLPLYHELGTSLLGNLPQQTRDDFDSNSFNRTEALKVVDQILDKHPFSMKIQLRIIDALSVLEQKAKTQELRFIRSVTEGLIVSREEALSMARALFVLSIEDKKTPHR